MKIQRNKGFTLIELLIVVVIVGILALAAIPLITANTRDARRSEGEQQLGSMKNRVKVAYAKLGGLPIQLDGEMNSTTQGCGATLAERTGKYFGVEDALAGVAGTAYTLQARANTAGAGTADDGDGDGNFDMLDPGSDEIIWSNVGAGTAFSGA